MPISGEFGEIDVAHVAGLVEGVVERKGCLERVGRLTALAKLEIVE